MKESSITTVQAAFIFTAANFRSGHETGDVILGDLLESF